MSAAPLSAPCPISSQLNEANPHASIGTLRPGAHLTGASSLVAPFLSSSFGGPGLLMRHQASTPPVCAPALPLALALGQLG